MVMLRQLLILNWLIKLVIGRVIIVPTIPGLEGLGVCLFVELRVTESEIFSRDITSEAHATVVS